MTADDFIAVARGMTRPCVLLSADGAGEVCGYRGGERADAPNRNADLAQPGPARRHLLTVGEPAFAAAGLSVAGPRGDEVSLTEVWKDRDGDAVPLLQPPRTAFAQLHCTGEPLYARPHASLPPLPAVCLYGPPEVERWLRETGLPRSRYDELPPEILDGYDAFYRAEGDPLALDADAVVGGWPAVWPEDHFYAPPEVTRLFLTLRDGEPHHGVWRGPRGFYRRTHVS